MTDLTYDITDKDVRWIQEQYRARFKLDIDPETAYRKLHLLVRQMELVYRPITKQQAMDVNEDVINGSKTKNVQ